MQHSFIHALDIIGSIFSLICTLYYVRANVLAWPTGLVASSLNIILYFYSGLYGDMSLEGFYFLSTFYGWYIWLRGGAHHQQREITRITAKHALILVLITVIGIEAVHFYLAHYTNSQVPYWDATTTVISLVAQWLICRKIIECWYLWFIVDAMYVGLYFYKGIDAHSILLVIYVGLAVAGYLRWRKLLPANRRYSTQASSISSTLNIQ